MESLCVHYVKTLHPQDGSLGPLTALTSLMLRDCGLRRVPAELTSLSATLCDLELDPSDSTHIDGAGVASIGQCSRLMSVGLHKPGICMGWREQLYDEWWSIKRHMEGYVPAHWSSQECRVFDAAAICIPREDWS